MQKVLPQDSVLFQPSLNGLRAKSTGKYRESAEPIIKLLLSLAEDERMIQFFLLLSRSTK